MKGKEMKMEFVKMSDYAPMIGRSFASRINLGNQINPVLRWNTEDVARTITVESGMYPAGDEFDRELPFEDICDVFGSDGMDWWNAPMDDECFNDLIKNAIIDTDAGEVIR